VAELKDNSEELDLHKASESNASGNRHCYMYFTRRTCEFCQPLVTDCGSIFTHIPSSSMAFLSLRDP
jgi:thioredoxin-related protein